MGVVCKHSYSKYKKHEKEVIALNQVIILLNLNMDFSDLLHGKR